MQYVILTVSNSEGIVFKYSACLDKEHKYTDTETYLQGLEGIAVTCYDNFEDFQDALTDYKYNNCNFSELLYQE